MAETRHPDGPESNGCHNSRKNGGKRSHRGSSAGKVVTPPRDGKVHYQNCTAARKAAVPPITRSEPGCGPHPGGDDNACE